MYILRKGIYTLKITGKGLFILAAGIFAGTVLLWMSYLLPLSEENPHVAESIHLLQQEGWYPVVPLMHQFSGTPLGINSGGVLDNFTDSIMITTAGHYPAGGALYQAMNMAGSESLNGYGYYWHGYVAVLRPLLFFLNYADIRVLNQLLQIVIVFVLTCLIYYRKGAPWAALALTTYGLLLPIAISQSLQYSWVFYIGVVGSLVIIRFRSWLAEKQRVYFFFLFLGMLTCYMDLLTYPLFTWGIPMIWWIVTENDEETERHQLASVILCGIAWICGYGGIWVGKWLIGGIILHQPLWKYAWGEVQYRAGIVPDSEGYMVAHLDVMLQNLNAYQNIQGISLLGGWIIWWLFQNTRRKQKVSTKKILALLLIALSPIAWYVILHNHTYMHSSFTYRIWIVALTALLALMINSMSGKEIQKCSRGKLFVPIILMFIAVLIGLTLKEETHVHNGSFEPTQLELTEQMELVQEFTPSFSTISALNLLLYTEINQTGQIEVLLMEENQIIQKFIIDADMVEGGKFYELPTNLQLKRNNSYRISISGKNLEGGHISVGLTDLGLFPLTELRQLQVDDQEYDAQIICGFRYRHRISLRKWALALELQLLVYWSLYLLWRKIIQGMRYKRSIYGKLKLIIKRKN